MPSQNFMVADLGAVTAGFLISGLFMLVPGYVFGWVADVLGFRRLELSWKVLVSVPLSIAVCPILTYLVGRFFSMTLVWWMYGAIWLGFAALLSQACREMKMFSLHVLLNRNRSVFLAVFAGWLLVGTLSLVDIQIGDRLYFSIVSHDISVRTAITGAISRNGFPPHNPFFYPAKPAFLRYHYFWLIPGSLTDQLAGNAVGPRQAMLACTLWCGLGLLAITFLYLRFFFVCNPANLSKRMLLAVGLFAVTGLDLIPTLLLLKLGITHPDMEWWNEQAASWIGSVLWAPHHVGSLIASLTGFSVLYCAPRASNRYVWFLRSMVAALAFATAAGSSVYVAFVCALFVGAWTVVTWLKGWHAETIALAVSGALALLLCSPYLRDLQGSASGGHFVLPAVRSFMYIGYLDPSWRIMLVDALMLPLNYLMEFGLFFLVGLAQFRWWRSRGWQLSREELCGAVMLAVSILVCTFLRSGVIHVNDLGMRGLLFAQFMLLLWAVDAIDRARLGEAHTVASPLGLWEVSAGLRRLMIPFLVIGVAGTVYEVILLRTYPILSDANRVSKQAWLSTDDKLGKRTYAVRRVYEELRRTLPAAAVVQHNPAVVPNDLFAGLYGDRQAVADSSGCAAVFGGDATLCPEIYSKLVDLYSVGDSDPKGVCRDLRIDVLVAKDTDIVWKRRDSWVWTNKPLMANGFARAFGCGN